MVWTPAVSVGTWVRAKSVPMTVPTESGRSPATPSVTVIFFSMPL